MKRLLLLFLVLCSLASFGQTTTGIKFSELVTLDSVAANVYAPVTVRVGSSWYNRKIPLSLFARRDSAVTNIFVSNDTLYQVIRDTAHVVIVSPALDTALLNHTIDSIINRYGIVFDQYYLTGAGDSASPMTADTTRIQKKLYLDSTLAFTADTLGVRTDSAEGEAPNVIGQTPDGKLHKYAVPYFVFDHYFTGTGLGIDSIHYTGGGATIDTTFLRASIDLKQDALNGTGIVKSTAGTISYVTDNSSNWNTAYGWGNHALAGYLTAETDPYAIAKSGTTSLTGNVTVDGGSSRYFRLTNARFQETKGANVAAANDLTLGSDGNVFTITGNTQINAILTTNWQAGSRIDLLFTGTPKLKHNTTGGAGTSPLDLAGDVDWTAAAGDAITLLYTGTAWMETTRKIAGVNGAKGSVTQFVFTNANGFTGTVSNSTTTPTLSLVLQNATTSQSGQLTSTDWNTFNNKEPAIVAPYTTGKYWNGFKSFVTLNSDSITQGTNKFIQSLSLITPNVIFATPVTFSNTSGAWSGTLSLNSQSAYTVFGNHTSGSATPTFGKLPVQSISATGTADATTYLRGDGTWATPAGGGGGQADSAYFWQRSGNVATYGNFVGTINNLSLRFRANNNEVLRLDSATGAILQTYGANSSTVLVPNGTTTLPATSVDRALLFGGVSSFNNAAVASVGIGHALTIGTGTGNVAIGYTANASGGGIAIAKAGSASTSTGGIAIGGSVFSGSSGVAIGSFADARNTDAIAIGLSAAGTGANSTTIGSTSVASANRSTAYGYKANATHQDGISIGSYSKTTATNQFVAGGFSSGNSNGITDVYFGSGVILDGATTGAGTSYTINGSGAFGSNQNGGNLTMAAGKGTGTGTSGDVIISTPSAAASGSTLQSLTTRFTVKGNTGYIIMVNVPTYADETAATTAGLATGTVYKSSDGVLRIKL